MATKAELETELKAFKELVINTTKDFDGGCESGKTRFLRELGLVPPIHTKYRVTFDVEIDQTEIDEYEEFDAKDYIKDAVVYGYCLDAKPDTFKLEPIK